MSPLDGTTALVTGASRGIGRAIALALAEEGVRLFLTARSDPALRELAGRLHAHARAADLTRIEDLDGLVEAAREQFGAAPAILVNAAGTFDLCRVAELPVADLERHWKLNLRAPILLVRAFLPEMLARGSGHLVHIGSLAGRRPYPENAAYAASKYGLRGFHEVLRCELSGSGVRTTLVEPGPVDTAAWEGVESRLGVDLPPRGAMLRPQAVAEAVLSCLQLGEGGAAADLLILPS